MFFWQAAHRRMAEEVRAKHPELERLLLLVGDHSTPEQKAIWHLANAVLDLEAGCRFSPGTPLYRLHKALEQTLAATESALRGTTPAHDCEAALKADPSYDRFRCQPGEWTCTCGRRWQHVCDEAEGCAWHPVEAT